MTDSNFYNYLGNNLKNARKKKGMSLSDLSAKLEIEYGCTISESMLSLIENGKRKVFSEQLYYICRVLHYSPVLAFPESKNETSKRLAENMDFLTESESFVIDYMLEKWDGNLHALIEFIGLYMSLPKKIRYDIAAMGVDVYRIASRTNSVSTDINVNISYIDKETDRLNR